MEKVDLKPLFAGADEARLIDALYWSMNYGSGPRNDAQRTFYLSWEATVLLDSGGFLQLLEQDPTLEDYADAFAEAGLAKVKLVFERVIYLIPIELRPRNGEEGKWATVESLFDPVRELYLEFYAASADVPMVLSRYVRKHRNDFVEYAAG